MPGLERHQPSMAHASHRNFGLLAVAVLSLLGVVLVGCLPDTLSESALHAKVLDATAGKGGPLCGNATVDPSEGETCDDGNTDSCDACDKCQVRTALDCKDGKSLAGLTTLGALQFDGKQSWSIESWFYLRSAPKSQPMPMLFIGAPGNKAGTATSFMMGVASVGPSVVPFCALEKVAKSTSVGAAVTINSWHHLRCVWNAVDGEMRASVDGGSLAKADNKLALKPAPGFEGTSWLLFGQLPAQGASSLQVEAFDGLLDEIRAAQGPNVAATQLQRRYANDTAETVALYHMDTGHAVRFLNDASANHLDADQITLQGTNTPIKRDADLTLAAEACYGFSAANAECAANPKPPWCP